MVYNPDYINYNVVSITIIFAEQHSRGVQSSRLQNPY